jgi:hypothetical protein
MCRGHGHLACDAVRFVSSPFPSPTERALRGGGGGGPKFCFTGARTGYRRLWLFGQVTTKAREEWEMVLTALCSSGAAPQKWCWQLSAQVGLPPRNDADNCSSGAAPQKWCWQLSAQVGLPPRNGADSSLLKWGCPPEMVLTTVCSSRAAPRNGADNCLLKWGCPPEMVLTAVCSSGAAPQKWCWQLLKWGCPPEMVLTTAQVRLPPRNGADNCLLKCGCPPEIPYWRESWRTGIDACALTTSRFLIADSWRPVSNTVSAHRRSARAHALVWRSHLPRACHSTFAFHVIL